jgi:peptidoglycan/LPS O-acetylase OafA/YrhL
LSDDATSLAGVRPPSRVTRRWFYGGAAATLLLVNLLATVLGGDEVKLASVYASNLALVALSVLYFAGGNLDASRILDAAVALRTGVAPK